MAPKKRKRKTLKSDPRTYPRHYKTKAGNWMVKPSPTTRAKRSKPPKALGLDAYRDKSGHTRSGKTGRLVTSKGAPKRAARPSEIAARIAAILHESTGTSWDYQTRRGRRVDMNPHLGDQDKDRPRYSHAHKAKWTRQLAFFPDDPTEVGWWKLAAALDAMQADKKLARAIGKSTPSFISATFNNETQGEPASHLNLASAIAWQDALYDATENAKTYGNRYGVSDDQLELGDVDPSEERYTESQLLALYITLIR